ncbi:MAG: hypothetical protein ABI589_13605 [Burkholderiales bacterium]
MAPQAAAAPLWPHHQGPEQVYPDLFADAPSATEPDPNPGTVTCETTSSESVRAWRPTRLARATTVQPQPWPEWDDDALADLVSPVGKFAANILALKTLQSLRQKQRAATTDESRKLLRFTDWGGIPARFNLEGANPAWVERARLLQPLLSEPDYEAARASVNNAHYTPPSVIRWVWSALQTMGFEGGRVLEPRAGIGHFIGCMPEALAQRSRITAVEI